MKKNQIELCAKLENPNGDKRDILSHSVYIEQLATHTFEEARAIARYDESTQLNVGSDVYDEESINSLEEAVNQFRNESTEEESVDEFTNEEVKNIFRSFDEEAMKSTENTFGSFD